MPKGDSISIRLDADTRRRLDSISSGSGLTVAELVRRATDEFLNEVEKTGQLMIPIRVNGRADIYVDNRHVAEARAIYDAGGKGRRKT